jgi:hypothetical protein
MFDAEIGKELVGKRILIGITYLDANGKLESQQQLHGVVHRANEEDGILIKLQGVYEGEEWNMPPDTSAISKAGPGIYKLRATEEEVENPDYQCTWEVHRPKNAEET